MGLSSKQFKEIFKDGFKQRYEDNEEGESELRCFECGEKAELIKKRRRWRVVCANNHKEKMFDFLLYQIQMRDGIADIALNANCNINS